MSNTTDSDSDFIDLNLDIEPLSECSDYGEVDDFDEYFNQKSEINTQTDTVRRNVKKPKSGHLKLVVGCMFSGKTSYLIRECKQLRSIGKKVLVVNHSLDKRYSTKRIVSHDKHSVDCVMINNIQSLTDTVKEYDAILINEAQFFADLNPVREWCDDFKKTVIVSGLDGDFTRNRFGKILDLVPDCDELIKLKALCVMCKNGTEAPFTWKIIDNVLDPELDTNIDVGTDQYVPLCRKHYNRERKNLLIKIN